jgi:hypothetical protein
MTIFTIYDTNNPPDFKQFTKFANSINYPVVIGILGDNNIKRHTKYIDTVFSKATKVQGGYKEIKKHIKTKYAMELNCTDIMLNKPEIKNADIYVGDFLTLKEFLINTGTLSFIFKVSLFDKIYKDSDYIINNEDWISKKHWLYFSILDYKLEKTNIQVTETKVKNTKIYDTFLLWCKYNDNYNLYKQTQTELENI